jgi:hypothetical protein
MSMLRTMVARTLIVPAVVVTLTLGVGAASAGATIAHSAASSSSTTCATASLTVARAKLLAILTAEKSTLVSQQTKYTTQLAADNTQLAAAPKGSEQAHLLASTIMIVNAHIAIVRAAIQSVNSDVVLLGSCTSAHISAVKKHEVWRKLVAQRSLVTAELKVAVADLSYRRGQLAAEKKARNTAAQKVTNRLIASDKSQIKTDKAELAGLAKKLAELG